MQQLLPELNPAVPMHIGSEPDGWLS